MRGKRLRRWVLRACVAPLAFAAGPLLAFDWAGEKAVIAQTQDGARQRIGSLLLTPQAGGLSRFELRLDLGRMQDHFLSMREFKCLRPQGQQAETEITCVVPYPYPHPATVGPDQLVWLEHNLLFLFKKPSDFGAKLWNGLMFRFELTPDALVGHPQAVDLNQISAPPTDPSEPPYAPFDRTDVPPSQRWLSGLRIE